MCSVTPAAAMTFAMDAQSPGRARAFLRSASCPAHNASVVDAAQLLLSELVTNAVRYATPPVTTEVACNGGAGMQVRVSDGSLRRPEGVRPQSMVAESGRGMTLVDVLSDAWGVEPLGDGKVVWFRLSE